MNHKKQIKILITSFVLLLTLFITTVLFFSYFRTQAFEKQIVTSAEKNLNIVSTLEKMSTALFAHHQIILGDMTHINGTNNESANTYKKLFIDNLKDLEGVNQNLFEQWIKSNYTNSASSKDELAQLVTLFKKTQEASFVKDFSYSKAQSYFQRLYYLFSVNAGLYFDQTQNLLDVVSATSDPAEKLALMNEQEEFSNLLLATIGVLKTSYDQYFWNYQNYLDSDYYHFQQNLFTALLIFSAIILLFSLLVVWRVWAFMGARVLYDDKTALLSARDLETGLYNQDSLQVFGTQELARAKRQGYAVTLLVVRVESYAQIRDQKGEKDAEQFVYQVVNELKKTCRVYDSLYRCSENTLAVLLSQASQENQYQIISRLQKTVFDKEYFVHNEKIKIKPRVSFGHSLFPEDGASIDELLQKAVTHLTDQNGKPVDDQVQALLETKQVLSERNESTKTADEEPDILISNKESEQEVLVKAENWDKKEQEKIKTHKPEIEKPKKEVHSESFLKPEPAVAKQDLIIENKEQPKKYVSGPIDDEKLKSTWESLVSAEIPANVNKKNKPQKEVSQTYEKDVVTQLLESVVQNAHKNPDQEEPVIEDEALDALPDIVAALNQEDYQEDDVLEPPVKEVISNRIKKEDTAPQKRTAQKLAYESQDFDDGDDDFDDITNISDIQIVNSQDDGDVIMVDFDEEKPDLATKFRRKLREKRKKLKIGL